MKITRYLITLAAAAGLCSACQDLDEIKAYSPEQVVAPVLHALPSAIAVTSENMGETVVFAWDAADFGVKTQINYSIEAACVQDGVEGSRLVLFSGMDGTSSEQTYESINAKLALDAESGGLGLPADEPCNVNYYVSATIGTGFETVYSEPVAVVMTVTVAERTYPTVWVIGDYSGWSFDSAQNLFSFSNDEVNYEGLIDFGEKAANGFKLTGIANWDDSCNWGTDGDAAAPDAEAASITLISSGGSGNITAYSHRFYRFAFSRSTLTLTKELSFDRIGVIGDFNGWAEDIEMSFDTSKQRFYADVDLSGGTIKFRLDEEWTVSFGVADGNTEALTKGVLDGGENIPVPAGKYRIYVNLNNSEEQTFELSANDYGKGGDDPEPDPEPEKADWYVHGQTVATPDWGGTPMEKACSNITAYRAAGVEVAANSEFLFKSGDETQWIGADQTFAAGSSPYPCTIGSAFKVSADKVNAVVAEAGVYDYWLLPDAGRAYVMAAGELPEYAPETWGICGSVTGWGDLGDFAMSEEGAYLVRKGVALTTSDQFKIRFNNEWNDERNYGTASGGSVDINTAVAVITSGGSQNMSVQIDGTYDIYFDLAGETVYVMSEGATPAE